MNPEAYIQMDEEEARHWWFSGRRKIITGLIENLELPQKACIREVGCGTGGNLEMLSHFGNVSAFEMDSVARTIATEKTNNQFDIRAGCCPHEIPFVSQKFDLICLFDVLEHIEQDGDTLTILRGMLAEKGKIIITVPACQWLWSSHDEFLHHKRRYSVNSLKEICCSVLKPLKISYFNTILFPLAVLMRLKDKLFKSKSVSGTNTPPKIINILFKLIFSLERFPLKYINFPFGLSLLCILESSEKNLLN